MAAARKKSTIVRQLVQLAALRAWFTLTERVAPAVGAPLAQRLWSTPPKGRQPRDARPGPGTVTRVEAAGATVVVETWGEGEPVYLLHGWGGWRGQLGAFVAPLVAAGHRVVAVDGPSHGGSGAGRAGKGRSSLLEFAETLTAVAALLGRPAAVIAHSMGGSAAALAVQDGLRPGRLALVAAPAAPLGPVQVFAGKLGIGPRTLARMIARVERVIGRSVDELDVRKVPALADVPPLLVVHDRDDREVPYANAEEIAAAWPEAELLTTEGLGHVRLLTSPLVVDPVVAFVTQGAARGSRPPATDAA